MLCPVRALRAKKSRPENAGERKHSSNNNIIISARKYGGYFLTISKHKQKSLRL